jgi:predicted AAA+ superfamily ATPase
MKQADYLTFDSLALRQSASASPESFLIEYDQARPLILDEAQKSPEIFDAIKKTVDENKIPGRFLLLGSTEFSRQTLIRESLTGRMSRVRVYPFDLAETIGLETKKIPDSSGLRKSLLKYTEHGGLPGICFSRDPKQREQLLEDWLGLICYRDLQQFKTLKLDGEIAYQIMKQLAIQPEPTLAAIASSLRLDSRRVGTHLKALEELFVVTRLLPHASGTGKPIFMLFDAGLAFHLGASLERRLHIWLMNEQISYESYFGSKKAFFYYYRSSGKKMIHLIRESVDGLLTAFQIINFEKLQFSDSELMSAFLKKNPGKAKGHILGPSPTNTKIKNVAFIPWERGCRYYFKV